MIASTKHLPALYVIALVVLTAATAHHWYWGYSDVLGGLDLLAALILLPGMFFSREILGLRPVGVWFSGSYPPSLLVAQYAVNVTIYVALFSIGRFAKQRWSARAA
jgi:hypothetical protein